jgi:hypothetical protein
MDNGAAPGCASAAAAATAAFRLLGRRLGMSMLDHELVNLVEALRASRRFTARSEEFLDSLLERAGRFDVVHLSPKQKRWLEDLALKAKGASA